MAFTVTVDYAGADPTGPVAAIQVVVSGPDVRLFQQLISRGMNTWNNAHPSMKRLHDLVMYGEILQNYNTPNQGNPPRDG